MAAAAALTWFGIQTYDTESLGRGPSQLLGALRAHARRHGRAWPKQETLARELGCSVRTVRRWLRILERKGVAEVKRTGRSNIVTLPKDQTERPQSPSKSAIVSERIRGEKDTGEIHEVVSTLPAEAATEAATTTPRPCKPEETATEILPTAAELREELAIAAATEAAWREVAPEAPERRQAARRRAWFSTRLEWLADVRRVAEALSGLPGWQASRGSGGVRDLADLWHLRQASARMASEEWRRSCLRWVRHHERHRHRRLGDLGGWLLRERHAEIEPPPPTPPPLPPPPPPAETESATETEAGHLWRCQARAGSCAFWREWRPAETEEPPPRCPHCGGHAEVCA